ncbi:YuzD family protein [Psychrobacillus sp. FJAT-21963]|uniref:YuzD family protein n=1 Tax=Psychrobacillus sp. FJAT-21963 TaxID=1712028 RepID=UPI0007005F8F|nr:YuzD family protein [Psychrobacillus sp. FJAT-21963]KQL33426.1 disulfide oxidoreductase [Psychrobacillus sp. FJAT-21963]
MTTQAINIEIFGADIVCASCLNAPSSKDTYEWLQAAIDRKFPNHQVTFTYIDIEKPIENEKHQTIANRIADDEFFYPLVMLNEEIIGEGYIQLKPVYAALEKYGYVSEKE